MTRSAPAARGAGAVARRLLLGFRNDRRTLALVLVVPPFVMALLGEVVPESGRVVPILLGVVAFALTYLLTAVGFLRERTAGTLERALVAPVTRAGLVLGYLVGYGVLAAVQTAALLVAVVGVLEVTIEGSAAAVVLLAVLGALTALGVGIALSLFADSEFQAVQFVPAVITPQVILGNTFRPVGELPWYLEYPARAMPVTHLVRGMEYAVLGAGEADDLVVAVVVLGTWTFGTVALSALLLGRRR